MSAVSLRLSRPMSRAPIRAFLFFALFYLYVSVRINPSLMYYWPKAGSQDQLLSTIRHQGGNKPRNENTKERAGVKW